MNAKNILVVGIGNSLRGDDGIGAYVCAAINLAGITGVQTLVQQQLHTSLLEDLLSFETIIIVDAAVSAEEVSLQPLDTNTVHHPVSSSHHVNASLLASLAQQLYHKKLNIILCPVKAVCFDMGETLSATAKKNADTAVSSICKWINNRMH